MAKDKDNLKIEKEIEGRRKQHETFIRNAEEYIALGTETIIKYRILNQMADDIFMLKEENV